MRMKIFRWKAIGPLLLLFVVIIVLVLIFAEPVARDTAEEISTELLGTQVDVGRLDLLPKQASADLGALQVADPFEPRRNLVEADRIVLQLNPEALVEKKLVVERFALQGMRFGTTRKTPVRPVSGDGFAPQALRSVRQWSQHLDVPLLRLTPIDTIRQLVLDPTQLGSLRAAQALLARTDWTGQALAQGFKAVVGEEVAKAEALARAKVDSIVTDEVEPVKQRIAAVQADATTRVAEEWQRLDKVEADLQAELKRLTGGHVPEIRLPKIKL